MNADRIAFWLAITAMLVLAVPWPAIWLLRAVHAVLSWLTGGDRAADEAPTRTARPAAPSRMRAQRRARMRFLRVALVSEPSCRDGVTTCLQVERSSILR